MKKTTNEEKLTARQKAFVEEYLIDLNGTQACLRAGYSKKGAYTQASVLLSYPKIMKAIQEKMAERSKRTEITQDRVLEEYAKIAFCDVRQFFNDDGTVRPVSEWSNEMAACIGALDVVESGGDEAMMAIVKKLKLIDRTKALDSLARHLGMFKDKIEHSGTVDVPKVVIELSK